MLLVIQIREFEYSPEAQESRKQELEKLLQDQENIRSSLLQWCYASYGEVYLLCSIYFYNVNSDGVLFNMRFSSSREPKHMVNMSVYHKRGNSKIYNVLMLKIWIIYWSTIELHGISIPCICFYFWRRLILVSLLCLYLCWFLAMKANTFFLGQNFTWQCYS